MALTTGVTHGGNIFSVARQLQCDWREILDFSASINPLGPASGVRSAIIAALDRITHYPDQYASRLQRALAEEWDVEPERILVGNGATELIHFLARIWPVRTALAVPVFSEFHRAYPDARLLFPGQDWPDDGLVVATNPGNPTGAAQTIPRRSGPTLVDESFLEFSNLPSQMHHGCIVLRSLTKFHALPGLRVGALVAPSNLAEQWQALREPWQVNVLAEAAALEALRDREHHRLTREYVAQEQGRIQASFGELRGVRLHPTCANYFFATLDYSAEWCCEYLLRHKVLLRNCAGWPGTGDCESVRFAIRSREDNDRLLALWRQFPCD